MKILQLCATTFLVAGLAHAASQPCGNNLTQSPSSPPSKSPPCNGDGANLFNAYTGNASRSVVDLSVFGSVGNLPLKMVRYSNTRLSSMAQATGRFGKEGAWTHSYQWLLRNGGLYTNGEPMLRLGFPDGADMAFIRDATDPTQWLPHANGDARITQSGSDFTLLRASGELYRFKRYTYTTGGEYYRLESFEDAVGNNYTLQYSSSTDTLVRKVLDASGRWLQFTYVNHGLSNQERTVLHTTTYPGTTGAWVDVTGISTAKAHRYLTLYYNNDWHNAPPIPVGEMEFYDENNVLITGGTPFGTEPLYAPGQEAAKAFDGNTATYYRYAYQRNGYVGLDLGAGVTRKVSRIRYFIPTVSGATPSASVQFVGLNGLTATHYSIKSVASSDGRSVVYNYGTFADSSGSFTWSVLDSTVYPDGAQALYGYVQVHPFSRPVLNHALDPRVQGAGSSIEYVFDPDTSIGFVRQEKNGITGELIAETSHDAAHQPKAVYASGRSVRYTYTGTTGSLTEKRNGLGHTTVYAYTLGGTGHLESETDARGNTTSYVRTALGNPLTITHPDGGVETITRDARERILTWTLSGPGLVTRTVTYTRDLQGRITRVDYPDLSFETWTYNAFGQVLVHQKRNGGSEVTAYSVAGVPQSHTDALGKVTTFVYNGLGLMVSATDANGHSRGLLYNDRGQVTRVTHADSSYVSYDYDATGDLEALTNELGKIWLYGYDEFNRLVSSTNPLGQTTTYAYGGVGGGCGACNTAGVPTLVTLPSGRVTRHVYDLEWRLLSKTEGYGSVDAATTSYGYDSVGNLLLVTNPDGHAVAYGYDSRNRVLTTTDALSRVTTRTYDVLGGLLTESRSGGGVVINTYDVMKRLLSTTDPGGHTTSYAYNAAGSLETMTDARGRVHAWAYDLQDRALTLTYPDSSTEEWTYDDVGNKLTRQTRQGQVATFTHDVRNRETGTDWSDGTPDTVRTYDAAGRLTSTANSHATDAYTYDDAGRVLTATQTLAGLGSSYVVSYGYNADGLRSSVTYPEGNVVDYTYTGRNQVSQIQADGPPPLATYTYHLDGTVAGRTLENAVTTTYAYDAANQFQSVSHANGAGTWQRFDYQYDLVGRRRAIQHNGALWDSFTFDAADQLAGAAYEGTTSLGAGATRQVTYAHDAVGNRQSVGVSGSGSALLPVIPAGVSTYGSVFANNQYPTVAGQTLTYDGNGNLTQVPVDVHVPASGAQALVYDSLNRLLTVTAPSAAMSVSYDSLNRQVSRTVNGVTTFFIWDGWSLVEERDALGALVQRYVHGAGIDEILSKTDASGTVYYHHDALGSVTALSDASGLPLETYRYDAYGAVAVWNVPGGIATVGSTVGNRFLYTGREWIAEVGLYDYRNRAYSAQLGRFLQTDPIRFAAEDANLYRYVLNQPLTLRDPSGLAPERERPKWVPDWLPIPDWVPWPKPDPGPREPEPPLPDPTNPPMAPPNNPLLPPITPPTPPAPNPTPPTPPAPAPEPPKEPEKPKSPPC